MILSLLLVGAAAFAAGGKEQAGKKITVATITYTTQIEWFYILEQNYKAVADKLGIELIQLDPAPSPRHRST